MILTATILALDEKEIQAATVPPITFVATALLVVAVILLGVDLVRRIRRAQFKEEIEQELAAEVAERDAKQAAAGSAETGVSAAEGSDAGPTGAELPETAVDGESDNPQA